MQSLNSDQEAMYEDMMNEAIIASLMEQTAKEAENNKHGGGELNL